MLEEIKSPADLKKLDFNQLNILCSEIREKIIDTVSENGGHLASNLGIVEATVALHRIFNTPTDTLIYDTGHQCYAHKLLTGRYDDFCTIRKAGGLSGFTNPEESEYDTFYEGHCGTSISAALGIAEANAQNGSEAYSISVIGDGAFTNGMVYEALNNCGDKRLRMIIILNDNEMSISKNTGAIHNYLSRIRTSRSYYSVKRRTIKLFNAIPVISKPLMQTGKWVKRITKSIFTKPNFFECLGVDYLGPVDGNNIEKLSIVLEEAKSRQSCCLVHMITKKGLGYTPAQNNPTNYHSVGKFQRDTGVCGDGKETFSREFGRIMCTLAEKNDKICAVTAAMCDGTGLGEFAQKYNNRFFDVGIAEEHAISFSAGLASKGYIPVCAIYSTFSQRCFDQLFHDIALQKLPLVLALDRAGIVPDDGITHQGIYDAALFSVLPGVSIYSPALFRELETCFMNTLNVQNLTVIRYPKGIEPKLDGNGIIGNENTVYNENIENCKTVIITYGRVSQCAYGVKAIEPDIGIIRLIKIYPLDFSEIANLTTSAKLIYFIEEGIERGGIGEYFSAHMKKVRPECKVVIKALLSPPPHGKVDRLYKSLGFTPESIINEISSINN